VQSDDGRALAIVGPAGNIGIRQQQIAFDGQSGFRLVANEPARAAFRSIFFEHIELYRRPRVRHRTEKVEPGLAQTRTLGLPFVECPDRRAVGFDEHRRQFRCIGGNRLRPACHIGQPGNVGGVQQPRQHSGTGKSGSGLNELTSRELRHGVKTRG
jgi:hypothetical protein